MKKIMLLISISFLLSGCGVLNFPTLFKQKAPDTLYKVNERRSITPKIMCLNFKGEKVCGEVAYETKHEISTNYENKDKPLSAWQKFCNWLFNLSLGTLLFSGIALATFGASPFIFLIRKLRKVKEESKRVKDALKETVIGIKNSNLIDSTPELHSALSSAQSPITKTIIDDLRREV